jgi:hypothetical protein
MYNKIIEGITKSFENIELNDYHMNKNLSSDNLIDVKYLYLFRIRLTI